MKTLPQQVSESVRRRNPHLYDVKMSACAHAFAKGLYQQGLNATPPPKRIRQSTKPLMNKLEQEWFDNLCLHHRKLIVQGITFRLANGLRYTPDVFCFDWRPIGELDGPTAWEVKGKWFTDDANAKLKMFATAYPEIRVVLVWKIDGRWNQQRVLP